MTVQDLAVITDPRAVSTKLEEMKGEGYQILSIYTIQQPPALHRLSIKVVKPDYQLQNGWIVSGEIYSRGGEKQIGLQRPLYDKLAAAAGILWDYRAFSRKDDRRNPRYCEYEAVGHIRGMDGVWRTVVGDKAIDMDIVEQELRDKYQQRRLDFEHAAEHGDEKAKKEGLDFCRTFASARDRDGWVNEKVRKDALQIQKHIVARAQSGAMNRCVEKALGLRKTYTLKELEKGFVMASLVFTPDPNHPQDRDFMLKEASGANILFRGPQETAAPDAPIGPPPSFPTVEAEDVEPIGGIRPRDEAPITGREASDAPPPATPGDPTRAQSARADFIAADPMQQTTILKQLMKHKAYADSNIKGVIVKWKAEDRCKLYDHLQTMPDAGTTEPQEEGALPFAK